MQSKFDSIYKKNFWGSKESFSGPGSEKHFNKFKNIFLSNFINENNIKYIYDVCGDCNWQYDFVKLITNKSVEYFGFDVSEIALKKAKEKNKLNKNMTFSDKSIDLTNYIIPCNNGDESLIIIKDVIQHIPLLDGVKMLQNIKKSGIKYIAITNHDKELFNITFNKNIPIGGFYTNNMFLEPFNFINPSRRGIC